MSTQNHYLDLITRFGGKKVAVIGDIMLDRSLFGVTERFSAEAPIPIVDVKSKVEQLGGAALLSFSAAGKPSCQPLCHKIVKLSIKLFYLFLSM